MPWAGIEKEIKLGPVTFWPFSIQASKRVGNPALRKHLEKYFQCYVDHQGQPVDTVTVCSHGPSDFRQLNPVEEGETRAAVDALIFSVICLATKCSRMGLFRFHVQEPVPLVVDRAFRSQRKDRSKQGPRRDDGVVFPQFP